MRSFITEFSVLTQKTDAHVITPISVISVLLLYYHLHLGVPSGLFLLHLPAKILCSFFIFSMHITCPVYLMLLGLITLIIYGDG
jgi:hypothetical protein